MDEIVEKLAEQTDGVLEKAYTDIVEASAKPLGIMFSLLPRTIRLGLSKWEKWIINGEESLQLTAEALQEKVKKIPEEKQCEPEAYVAVPAIQQIAYCFNSEILRDMYANLLASSMNMDKKWEVHPSFVDIIKQITPDEAKLLKIFPRNSGRYIAVMDLKINLENGKGEQTIARNIVDEPFYKICDVPDNMSSYLENLCRLKIIEIPEDLHITEDKYYSKIENSQRVLNLKEKSLGEGNTYICSKKLLYVTDFGIAFTQCCIDEQ